MFAPVVATSAAAFAAEPPAAAVVRSEARTQKEVLDAAGVDAGAPLTVTRRVLCRGRRGRNILLVILVLLVFALVLSSRNDDRRAYLYSPVRDYAEDPHLESVHWAHFRRGAPVIILAKNISSFQSTALLSVLRAPNDGNDSSSKSSAAELRQLFECVKAKSSNGSSSVNNSTTPTTTDASNYDENGFSLDQTPLRMEPSLLDDLRIRVLPVMTAPGVVPREAIFRQLPWSRLLFVLTNVTSLDSPDVACLCAMQVTAVVYTSGEWFATHNGLTPPHRVHLVSIALPIATRRSPTQLAAQKGSYTDAGIMTRFSLILSPQTSVREDGKTSGTFTWWAGKRALHTHPITEGLVVVAPPSPLRTPLDAHSALDDAVLTRIYHEHITASTNASVIAPTRTVRLSTDLAVVAPVFGKLGPITRSSDHPLILTVRPDGFGVFRCPDVALEARLRA